MKETSFIEQNKEKWNKFEQLYASNSNDPEELSNLYMDITDDLSYARTFYKRRTVRVYLNQLAQKVFIGVHKQKKDSISRLFTVWKTSLPLEIYRSRKNLLFALVTFLIYVGIGVVNTYINPDFTAEFLGSGYVEMTEQNIANGNPLGVYETDDQLMMFNQITFNNLRVAFLTFFAGFFFTIGTHVLLFYNGIMLGTFQYFFYTKGLLLTSFLGIWIHGAFEISAIVLAAGAGITAGNGLLFPKSYTRLQSLQLSTKRGLKIMLSLVPFIIIAGFLESFVTANYQAFPDWSKWLIILFSFGLILFYYLFYPIYVARKNPELVDLEEVANFKPTDSFNFYKIRTVGENLADTFSVYRMGLGKIMKPTVALFLPLALLAISLQLYNHFEDQYYEYEFDWLSQLNFMFGLELYNILDIIAFIIWSFVFAGIFTSVFHVFKTIKSPFSWKSYFSYFKARFISIWVANILLFSAVTLIPWEGVIITIFIIPFFFLLSTTVGLHTGNFFGRLKQGFKFSAQHYGSTLLQILIYLIIIAIVVQPIASVTSIHNYNDEPSMMSDLLDLICGFVQRIAAIYTDDYMVASNAVRQLFYLTYIFLLIPLIVISMSFSFLSEREKHEATGLKKEFELFGKRSRIRETDVDFE